MVSNRRRPRRDPTEQRIRAFEQRYGRWATNFAAHAAFPFTLTTEVMYCLRESFFPDYPWHLAADVLLSGLCTPVGFDLYEMEPATRRYMLRYLRDQFGEERVNKLADFMAAYLRRQLGANPPNERAAMLGEKPQWTALACLKPDEAFDEIYRALELLARSTDEPEKLFRMASIVESYGDLLAERGLQLLQLADNLAEQKPLDAAAEETQILEKLGFQVNWVEFQVATVTFGVGAEDSTPPVESDLKTLEFETVTVNDRGEIMVREPHTAPYFEESLGKDIAPLKLMAIPSGEFMMGSPEDEHKRYINESPQHRVTVQPFFMGQTPVTQAHWQAVAAMPQIKTKLNLEPARNNGDDRPVEHVNWYQAVEFCQRLSVHTGRTYRLPTEIEWEYACRADTSTAFYFGETLITDLANYNGKVYRNEPEGKHRDETVPVGQFPPNSFGLYDIHGNVREWCQDHWPDSENYEGAPTDGSAWISENKSARRITRGGAWYYDPRRCRSACRDSHPPDHRSNDIGFRVVCEAHAP
ncbi:MAG: formylglycine-generating enzyme family protein [Cyanobacteria bacterium P01_B01_bin.77]